MKAMQSLQETQPQDPHMRHVQSPEFLAGKLRRDVLPAVQEILAIGKRSSTLQEQVNGILQPVSTRVRAVSRLCGLVETGQALPDAIERVAQKLGSMDAATFSQLPSFQHFYRGRGERIWTSSAGLFAAVGVALAAASQIDPSLFERYHKLDLLPASPVILTRDGAEL